MSKDEFFAFMPLLLYGIAISNLVMHWRDYLKKDRRYWPHVLTGIMLLELAFVNFYYLYDKLELLFETYHLFLMRLSPPLIFLLTSSVYTPEEDREVKEYFHSNSTMVYSLLALFISINTISEFQNNFITKVRITAILLAIIIAVTRKYWIIWVWVSLRVTLFIIELYYPELLI